MNIENRLFLISLILASILIVSHAAQPIGGDWTSFTLNNNDTRFQVNSTINAHNIGDLTFDWFINTTSPVTSQPIVMNGNVYFSDWNGNVYSANVLTGSYNSPNWEVNLGHPISSTPLVHNGVVYIGLGPGNRPTDVYALSEYTGNVIWNVTLKTTSENIWASPIIYRNLLYIGVTGDANDNETNASTVGSIFALNATTGKVAWNFITMIGNTGGDGVWSTVVVDPVLNSIYFGTGNPYIENTRTLYGYSAMSLNAINGKLNWYHQIYNSIVIGQDDDFGSSPNLFSMTVNGTAYNVVGIGNKDGNYYVFNRVNGALLGKYKIGYGEVVGILGLAGVFYPKGSANPEVFVPAHYNTSNTTGEGGVLEALYPSNGTVAWRVYTPGTLIGSVTVIPGAVLVGDAIGNLYALNISDGRQLFYTSFNHNIEAGVTVAESHLFVPTAFGSGYSTGVDAFSIPQSDINASIAAFTTISTIQPTTVTTIQSTTAFTTVQPSSSIPATSGASGGNSVIQAVKENLVVVLVIVGIILLTASLYMMKKRME